MAPFVTHEEGTYPILQPSQIARNYAPRRRCLQTYDRASSTDRRLLSAGVGWPEDRWVFFRLLHLEKIAEVEDGLMVDEGALEVDCIRKLVGIPGMVRVSVRCYDIVDHRWCQAHVVQF